DAEFADLISYKFNLAEFLPHFPPIAKRYAQQLKNHYVINTVHRQSSLDHIEGVVGIARWNVPWQLTTREDYQQAAGALFDEALPPLETVDRATSSVCTFGSCFAANLARVMIARGLNASNLLIEESINSTYANRALLEVVCGREEAPVHRDMRAAFGDELFDTV